MRQIHKVILFLFVLVGCASCKDMFIREVDFAATSEPEMLVLKADLNVGSAPCLEVRHTFHADAENKNDGYVDDAWVDTRINGVAIEPQRSINSKYNIGNGKYILKPFDTVEFTVTHPDYPVAYARTIMPNRLRSTVLSAQFRSNYWTLVTIEFDPYMGNPGDMVGISGWGYLLGQRRVSNKTDTLRLDLLYSKDSILGLAENLSNGEYYGAPLNYQLYFLASELSQKRQITFLVDHNWNTSKSTYSSMKVGHIYLEVSVFSSDYYRFDLSRRRYLRYHDLPAPSGLAANNYTYANFLEDASYYLGTQELVQIYTNVEGGIGHVDGSCISSIFNIR